MQAAQIPTSRFNGVNVALGLGLFEDRCQTVEEGLAVFVVAEDLSSFYSPSHDVLEKAGGIKSWLAGHLVSHRGRGVTEVVREPLEGR